MSRSAPADAIVVTPPVLRDWPLPRPDDGAGKEGRGDVFVAGGSPETPGAVLLAGLGALRAGGGRLQLATDRSAIAALGIAVPEARVLPLDGDGVERSASAARAVLVGTGCIDVDAGATLLDRVAAAVDEATVVVDAKAAVALRDRPTLLHGLGGRVVVMPNPSEMAALLGVTPDEVDADPVGAARRAATELRAVVALRGAITWLVAPGDDRVWRDDAGNPGLGTSGSGDVLGGVIAGLAARGADPLQAALWGVHAHGVAGDRLAGRIGPLGYLARELLDELPAVLVELSG